MHMLKHMLNRHHSSHFQCPHESNASIGVTHLNEKGLHISVSVEIANFLASVVGSADLKGNTTSLSEVCQIRAGVLIHKL
jgi:hypothetical protein